MAGVIHAVSSPRAKETKLTERRSHFATKLGAAVLVITTIVAYAPSLNGSFLWDDAGFTYESPVIRDNLSPLLYWQGKNTPDYYPVLSTAFYLQWQLFERDAPGYRAVNLAFHIIACLLLWRVLFQLRLSEPAAWFGAMLFALHPVNVASVAWIAEQKNTLSMVFCLGALLAYLRFDESRSKRAYALALVLFAVGILSKASIVILPAGLAVLIVYRRGSVRKADVVALLPMFALAAVGAALAIYFQHNRAITPHGPPVRPEGLASRIAASGWIMWFYISKAILPVNLMMVYPRWSVSGSNPIAYLPLAAMIALCGVLLKIRSAWLTPLAWFLIALLPVLGLIDMSYHALSLVADHWVYVALPGVTTAAAVLVVRGIKHPGAKLAVMAAMCIALFVLTFQHSEVYRHPRLLWGDNVKRNPKAWLAYNNLGLAIDVAEPDKAVEYFLKAIELNPNHAKAHYNLGYSMAQRKKLPEAIKHFQIAADLDPLDVGTRRDLGRALMQHGEIKKGLEHLRIAAQMDPGHENVLYWYSIILSRAGEYEEAVKLLADQVALHPNDPVLNFEYGSSLLGAGQTEAATRQLTRTRQMAQQVRNQAIVDKVDGLLQQ